MTRGAPDVRERMRRAAAAARNVARWYLESGRDLPWRKTADPYRIWVSEIMLQQTRVETALKYYGPFLERFPSLEALASSSMEEVLKAWEGLGYYGRARNLHRGARYLAGLPGWPRDVEGLLRVPGVGPSTAGAVASFAFGLMAPILDGNVRRIWCRLFAIRCSEGRDALALLWSLSERAVAKAPPAQVNQGMMDLGALLCLPRDPCCAECPVRRLCEARRRGVPEEYPEQRQKRPVPTQRGAVGFLWRRNRFLIARRKPEGLLGGLWELPGGKIERGEKPDAAVVREFQEELGLAVRVTNHLGEVRHAYTHFRVRLSVFRCVDEGRPRKPLSDHPLRWIGRRGIDAFPFPGATHKAFALAFSDDEGGGRR